VPRGHAVAHPTKYVLDEEEYNRVAKIAKIELEDAKEDLEDARQALERAHVGGAAKDRGDEMKDDEDEEDEEDDEKEKTTEEIDDDLKEYDLEHYDDDEEDAEDDEEGGANKSIFGNIKSLAYYKDQNEDPYITVPEDGNVSDEEEREELQILPTDNLVLAARIEDEVCQAFSSVL
jgi:periodic tryptophan protein 1